MKVSYATALAELQAIVAELQQGQTDLDELEQKLQRARALVAHCQKRLRQTEQQLDGFFQADQETN